ncbi:hypothetical protein TNCV_4802351 [Trichonephila clavipes]|nr:hypothetical protein TNCV_4802351 [Trichonephila clavipes]
MKVECTVAEGQDVGSCNQKSGHFGTNNVASIDSTPLSFQTSSAIKRNHKETTDRSWLEEPTSAKTLSAIFADLGQLRLETSSSVMNPDSVMLMTTAHVSAGAPASGPIRHFQYCDSLRHTAISQEQFLGTHDHL